MPKTTNRLAQIYIFCLVVMAVAMFASGCSSRRSSNCEGPYTVYHRPASCGRVPYYNSTGCNTNIRPASKYWSNCQRVTQPCYSKGWYHSIVPYRQNYRHRHFGTCGH